MGRAEGGGGGGRGKKYWYFTPEKKMIQGVRDKLTAHPPSEQAA